MSEFKITTEVTDNRANVSVFIDIERMQEALDSESRRMPSGLTKEQMRQWLIDFANEP